MKIDAIVTKIQHNETESTDEEKEKFVLTAENKLDNLKIVITSEKEFDWKPSDKISVEVTERQETLDDSSEDDVE